MADIRKEVVEMLNTALTLEHAARIQYMAHAELISGLYSEAVIERVKEIAGDEKKHEEMFRNLIGNYFNAEPTMALAETHKAKTIEEILKVNIGDEKHAIDFYKQIYSKVVSNKEAFTYEFETLEHEIRHVIIDEQEHVTELAILQG
jgi:bacterioferritin (cytochrome b1)